MHLTKTQFKIRDSNKKKKKLIITLENEYTIHVTCENGLCTTPHYMQLSRVQCTTSVVNQLFYGRRKKHENKINTNSKSD